MGTMRLLVFFLLKVLILNTNVYKEQLLNLP